MKPLLDVDVLVDIALDRAPFFEASKGVTDWCQQRPLTAVVAWHTVSNLYYVLRSALNDARARAFISDVLRFATVVSGSNEAVKHALHFRMSDFEDALQVAAALGAGADVIITRNLTDYRHVPLAAITPQKFLDRIHER